MSVWDSLDNNGSLNGSKPAVPTFGESRCNMSIHSDSGQSVSSKLEAMQSQLVNLAQQMRATEDHVTGVVKATSNQSSETARYQDVWNLQKSVADANTKSEAERKELMERLNSQAGFIEKLVAAQDEQKEAFVSFANEIRRKNEEGALPVQQVTGGGAPLRGATPITEGLENSMCAEMDPFIQEMARRAGIGLEDLHEIALKITEVNKSDAVAELQLAHVEKVNDQLKEISLKKMEGEQIIKQQEMMNALQQQTLDKDIRLAEIDAETTVESKNAEFDKDVRNHRDVEISRARWDTLTAVSEQWSQFMTTAVRWGAVGGGVSFVAYCCVQIAQVYFK